MLAYVPYSFTCNHQKCTCIEELAMMLCRNISSIPRLNSSFSAEVSHIIFEHSRLGNLSTLQLYYPAVNYVKLRNSSIHCKYLNDTAFYIESDSCFSINNTLTARAASGYRPNPRFPSTFYTTFPALIENTAAGYILIFMLCIVNISALIGHVFTGRYNSKR